METLIHDRMTVGLSLAQFHARLLEFATQKTVQGITISCYVTEPTVEGQNLPMGTYSAVFMLEVYESWPIFIAARQLSDRETALTIETRNVAGNFNWDYLLQPVWDELKNSLQLIQTATHGHEPTTTAPPWDRLATKDRWSNEDWIYFFDCLVPKSDTANVTPNFKALSDVTVQFANNRKSPDYIDKKYYKVYLPYIQGHNL